MRFDAEARRNSEMAYLSSEVVRVARARIRAKREIRILVLATRRALA